MSRRQRLRALVCERMTAAAEEIFTTLKLHRTGNELEIPEAAQMKEEPEEQTLRALVTERLAAAAEEIFEVVERTIAEYEEELCRCKEEEKQRRQEVMEEESQRRRRQRGAEILLSENPPEAARPVLKQENCDDLLIHEVKVKEEDPEEPPVTLPRESHMEENAYETRDVKEEVQDWTVPLRDDPADEAAAQREFSVFPKNKTLVCSFCKVKFARPCQLRKHMVVHGCSFCQKICPSEKNLKLHMMLHTGEQPFQCPACDKRFRSRGFLNNHIKMKHSSIRPFKCSVCSAAFMSKHLLRQHMYQHTGRRAFGCSLCQDTFKRKYELENHMSKHHTSKHRLPTAKLKPTGHVQTPSTHD